MKSIRENSALGLSLSIVVGAIIWGVGKVLTETVDATPGTFVMTAEFPLTLVSSCAAGAIFVARPWRWPVLIIVTQLVLGFLTFKGEPNLWPIGLVIYAVLAAAAISLAYFAAGLAKAHRRQPKGSDSSENP